MWQGFRSDAEMVIDMGKETTVTKISAGFLQDINVWIWLPTLVEYAVSKDGKDFIVVATLPNTISEQKQGSFRKEIAASFNPVSVRYIRVKAKNIGFCPNWHKGSGGQAWLFMDEISVD
jgi:hypothetical protein